MSNKVRRAKCYTLKSNKVRHVIIYHTKGLHMKKSVRIAIRIDSNMDEFLKKQALALDITTGQYVRQLVKGKMNEINRTKT